MQSAATANAAAVGSHLGRRTRGGSRVFKCYTGPRLAIVMRAIVIVALIAVVTALFTALVFLYRDRGRGNRVVIALAVRVVLSMALIAFLVISWYMGWIAPGGL